MTYQTVYSSESTIPMQAEDLEELLEQARNRNGNEGISGALIYTNGIFLQILEGERPKVQALMASIVKDVRHENVVVLREGEVPSPKFGSWRMAYVSATPAEVASWAGLSGVARKSEVAGDVDESHRRTAQFVADVLALLTPEKVAETAQAKQVEAERRIG